VLYVQNLGFWAHKQHLGLKQQPHIRPQFQSMLGFYCGFESN